MLLYCWESKIFADKRRGGNHDTPLKLSQCTEKLHRGNLLCFRIVRVTKKFKNHEGKITDFYRKFVVSIFPKKYLGKPSVFWNLSGIEHV